VSDPATKIADPYENAAATTSRYGRGSLVAQEFTVHWHHSPLSSWRVKRIVRGDVSRMEG